MSVAMFKKLNPQTIEKENLKEKVYDNVRNILNEWYFVYQSRKKRFKCKEQKRNLTTKNWDLLMIMSLKNNNKKNQSD